MNQAPFTDQTHGRRTHQRRSNAKHVLDLLRPVLPVPRGVEVQVGRHEGCEGGVGREAVGGPVVEIGEALGRPGDGLWSW